MKSEARVIGRKVVEQEGYPMCFERRSVGVLLPSTCEI